MTRIRTLIVDDESLSRAHLRGLLEGEAGVEIIGECDGGKEAVSMIRRLEPDLVFLDVQMPDLDGFEVVAEIGAENCPAIVFATAFDTFALQAFQANAVDYLLKPVSAERLHSTLERAVARARLARSERFPPSVPALVEATGAGGFKERLAVRIGGRYQIVRTKDVVLIEAADNYVRLRTADADYLYRTTMVEMLQMLDPTRFVRIHRSIIINVEAVEYIEPWGMGEFLFVLAGGRRVSSSRRYRDNIKVAFDC